MSARRIVQLEAGLARSEARFEASVGSLIDPFVLLRPVRTPDGAIVDFVYEYANSAARDANVLGREELVGTLLRERIPQLAPVGLFEQYVNVFTTNCPLVLTISRSPRGVRGSLASASLIYGRFEPPSS